ncbi:MAG TPA: integrase core domain-containing protein [Paludibacteraceae bacterium]|nr:integrase core domain-containing protein [Paludibacteraceae bacterium]HPL77036.1 integrase core domain-containing protein [Paludibacteraceae bacterium]HQG67078.1 integrase core domain-containing protein [Paludibacteraceae bacterium]
MEHRLTRPNTPKTNGMVERANGIIKKETILKDNYANIYIEHSRNKEEMNNALMAFLVYYMLYRRHSGLRKRTKLKNSFSAV